MTSPSLSSVQGGTALPTRSDQGAALRGKSHLHWTRSYCEICDAVRPRPDRPFVRMSSHLHVLVRVTELFPVARARFIRLLWKWSADVGVTLQGLPAFGVARLCHIAFSHLVCTHAVQAHATNPKLLPGVCSGGGVVVRRWCMGAYRFMPTRQRQSGSVICPWQ